MGKSKKLNNLVPVWARSLPISPHFYSILAVIALSTLLIGAILNFINFKYEEKTVSPPSILGTLNKLENELPDELAINSIVINKGDIRIKYTTYTSTSSVKLPISLQKLATWIKSN